MYVAAVRLADDFGCDAIGIQYQQGLKDLLPASDLVEGMLNNTDRPPVRSRDGRRVLFRGRARCTHFNEVDECAGLDGLMTQRVHAALGQPVENTLHDVRWGDAVRRRLRLGVPDQRRGAARALHRRLERRAGVPPAADVLSRTAAARCTASAKPGEIVWSRIYVEDEALHMDIGRGGVVALPEAETRAALDGHHAAVADHARGHLRRLARSVDGHTPGQSHPGRLRDGRLGRRRLPVHEGRLRPRARHSRPRLRRPRPHAELDVPMTSATAASSARYAWFIVALLFPVALLNYLDRQMLATMKTSMVGDIAGIASDAQWGFVLASFKWVYAILSPVGGFIADRFSRRHVIAISLFTWSAVTWWTGHVTSYDELVTARALMGVSEAFYIPAALALISDYHLGPTRSRAVGLHQTGIYAGLILGGFAGYVADAPEYGWRWAFGAAGVVGILYAVPLFLLVRNPPGLLASAASSLTPLRAVRELFTNRNYLLLVLYFTLPAIAGWVIRDWMPVILKDQFSLSQGRRGRHRRALGADRDRRRRGGRRRAGGSMESSNRARPHLRERDRHGAVPAGAVRSRQSRHGGAGDCVPAAVRRRLGILRLQQHAHPLPDHAAATASDRLRLHELREHLVRRLRRLGLRRA